jgi:hypothetical protein
MLRSLRKWFRHPPVNEAPVPPPARVENEPGKAPPTYDADNLRVWYKSVDFLQEPAFVRAYRRGMDSGHHICRERGSSTDLHIEWRIHTIIWAACQALKLPGDFVECGVNTGMNSLALCDYLDFNRTGRSLYLFDTFCGIPPEQVSERERALGRLAENGAWYSECFELARKNFAPYHRAVLVRGKVPDTLSTVPIEQVCYLSLDMNIVEPEIAAISYFWDKLSPGAPVVLDDYGWQGFAPQKEAMDDFAASKGVKVLTLPTGQGLLLKPPA